MKSYGNRRIVMDKKRLEEFYTEWYIAKGWKDKRSREKRFAKFALPSANMQ